MKSKGLEISPFFLSMFKHEMANGINNLYQIGMSVLDEPDLEEGAREDLKYDHVEALDKSQTALNKLHTLLYTNLIPQSDYAELDAIFNAAKDALPLNPTTIHLNTVVDAPARYPAELSILVLSSLLQLIIRNDSDAFDNGIRIDVSETNSQMIHITFSGTSKDDLFEDLKNQSTRYEKKSKMAFEYEFLLLLLVHKVIALDVSESSVSFKVTV